MIQKELIGDLKLKWDRIQQAMRKINADGCLLTVDVNLYYTTGRIYSGYFYLPAEGAPWFFVKRPNGLAGDHVEYIRKPELLDLCKGRTGNAGKASARSRRTDIQRLYTSAKDLQSERDRKRNRNDA